MIAPMMHRVNVYMHYFFVPNRLVYDNWQNYITGGSTGLLEPTFPTIELNEANKTLWDHGSLADYLGVPAPEAGSTLVSSAHINALPFRAYQLIYNEFYRDQTLTPAVGVTKLDTVSSGEEIAIMDLRYRSWEKDYFTSALPWTQRGATVVLPNTPTYKKPSIVRNVEDDEPYPSSSLDPLSSQGGELYDAVGLKELYLDNITGIDISIINLRRAARLQEWLEKNATGGSRYIEQILAHFGVKSSDARLQRPEYLGGGKTPVVISEVVSMVKEATNPQGTMAGHGISVGNLMGFNKFFEEHGFVIGIMSVMPRTAYQQGLPRMFSKVDRFDYYWPEFAEIGEQPILQKEVMLDLATILNDNVFGYTPRYAEYKFNLSTIHGDFKTSLSYWHMARIFVDPPVLNDSFVECVPTVRPFAVETGDHLWIQLYNSVKALRPMPVFGTPRL